jgi:uncharacterized membrane protein (UPF0127 family)
MKNLLLLFLIASAAFVCGQNPDRIYQLKELRNATITAGPHKIKVWIMNSATKRNEGMMFLKDKDVRINEGMLFVFAAPQPLGFWMRNTMIPLDIAYADKAGKILNTAQMKALDESNVPSKGSALYALEMKKGAFKKLGIKAGMKLGIPKTIKASG